MSLKPDQHYIDRTRKGDANAFAVLIDRYKDMVYTLALRMLQKKEDAEEIAQDVFLKSYQGLTKFKGDSKFSTWLYTITYNRSLDYIRKNNRMADSISIDAFDYKQLSITENAMDVLEGKQRRALIKRALDKMNPDDATVLTLFYFEELTLQEIAEVIGINSNLVKVRLHRSRKKLALLLSKTLEPEISRGYGQG